jgi:hypothetical protein
MALVRIHRSPKLNPWDREPPDFERVAREWFANYTDPRPSVYEANAPVEEVEAVAAFSLTNPGMSLTVYHLMRIEWSDLEALGRRTQVDDADRRRGLREVSGPPGPCRRPPGGLAEG